MASVPPTLEEPTSDEGETDEVKTQLKNSRWSLVARLAMAGGALLSMLILSISLKVEDFGRFAGVIALVAILGGLARMGSSELMLERLARDPDDVKGAYGRAMGTTIAASVLGVLAVTALRPVLLPNQALIFVILLALGEFFHVAGLDTGIKLFNACLLYTSPSPRDA